VFYALQPLVLTTKAPYIADQSKIVANTPAVQEYEVDLPTQALSPGVKVRIPDEMMPSDALALEYFNCFFTNVHPFMPVLCQNEFYHRWNTNRDSLSPLLLEAMFACATALLKRTNESSRWLALAASKQYLCNIFRSNQE
jgi:hypothetical protein